MFLSTPMLLFLSFPLSLKSNGKTNSDEDLKERKKMLLNHLTHSFKKIPRYLALARWLSWLQCCPAH